MSQDFVVFKRHTFEPANEVYFFDDLLDALLFANDKEVDTDTEWAVADIVPVGFSRSRVVQMLISIARKVRSW